MDNRNPKINRLYPISGGIISAINAAAGKHAYKTITVHGLEDCIALLESMENGELDHCVVEMSVCRGSCIEGPAIAHHKYSRFRKKLIVEDIVAGESEQPKDFPEKPNGYFSREFHDRSITVPMPTEAEIREILRKIGKNSEKDELNCTACGYPSCREKAIAVYQGKAELNMCMPLCKSRLVLWPKPLWIKHLTPFAVNSVCGLWNFPRLLNCLWKTSCPDVNIPH